MNVSRGTTSTVLAMHVTFERSVAPNLEAFLAAEPKASLHAKFDSTGFWTVEINDARGYAIASACRLNVDAALRRLDADFSPTGVCA